MQTNPYRKTHYPQFERSPEAFPALTIYPDGWDMSELLSPSDTIPPEICSGEWQFSSDENKNPGTPQKDG